MFHKNLTNKFRKMVIREGNVMTNNKQIIYDTRDKMPYEKLSNATHQKVIFTTSKNLCLYLPLGCESGHSSK